MNMRLLTATFALLLAWFGAVAAPVSRLDAGRDSSAIVWIAEREAEPVSMAVRVCAAHPSAVERVAYRSRSVAHIAAFDLFQRPPPIA